MRGQAMLPSGWIVKCQAYEGVKLCITENFEAGNADRREFV